jgi:hypothetical protein
MTSGGGRLALSSSDSSLSPSSQRFLFFARLLPPLPEDRFAGTFLAAVFLREVRHLRGPDPAAGPQPFVIGLPLCFRCER